ncbi:hypothetical protein ZEAMMB73_Zm00001d010166 [Zea mays]|uniref:Uncharacterized protein n=1 Tax=Zea mays TaxID=4577 RepID=A0A1D6FPK0_MAIZE|nr:hypothetical protein ZEAMMB73_Zm00001d010166 [Zea mays]
MNSSMHLHSTSGGTISQKANKDKEMRSLMEPACENMKNSQSFMKRKELASEAHGTHVSHLCVEAEAATSKSGMRTSGQPLLSTNHSFRKPSNGHGGHQRLVNHHGTTSFQPALTHAWGMKLYRRNYLLLSTYMTYTKYKNLYNNFMLGQAQLVQTWMNKNVISACLFDC